MTAIEFNAVKVKRIFSIEGLKKVGEVPSVFKDIRPSSISGEERLGLFVADELFHGYGMRIVTKSLFPPLSISCTIPRGGMPSEEY